MKLAAPPLPEDASSELARVLEVRADLPAVFERLLCAEQGGSAFPVSDSQIYDLLDSIVLRCRGRSLDQLRAIR